MPGPEPGPVRFLTVDDLAAGADLLDLGPDGVPVHPLLVLDLDRLGGIDEATLERATRALSRPAVPVVGTAREAWSPAARRLAPLLDLTLTTEPDPPVSAIAVRDLSSPRSAGPDADLDAALELLTGPATASPRASAVLAQVLRASAPLAVPEALAVESFAYSMLLSGPEFRRWRERTPRRRPSLVADPVRLERDGDRLRISLDHPARRNAYSRAVRDRLVEAFDLVAADPTVRSVLLDGTGPAFCSGGDLDEFGTMDDVSAAHLVRLRQGAAAALHRIADRVSAHLHGPCIGAGIELPAFAGRVVAARSTAIRLPELGMGLIPGAGGTVGIPRRIGRWRTAFLALSGHRLNADTAWRWGLVDELADRLPDVTR
jgi:enoyl-CoA hydratase/carnithine racemase